MAYPKTGNEVFVSFSLSNTMFSGIGKGTITREEVSADYLKDLFAKYGVIVSAKPEQRPLLELINERYGLELELVVLPGKRLPKLPSAAKQCIRVFDPETDVPLPYDPPQKIPEVRQESHRHLRRM